MAKFAINAIGARYQWFSPLTYSVTQDFQALCKSRLNIVENEWRENHQRNILCFRFLSFIFVGESSTNYSWILPSQEEDLKSPEKDTAFH